MDIRPAGRVNKWTSSQKQLDVISNTRLSHLERMTLLMLESRNVLWKEGTKDDIKPGKFLASNRIMDDKASENPELYDKICSETDKMGRTINVGWTRGLNENISIKLNGQHILVMDDHYFAAAFIIEMMRTKVLRQKSNIMHFDEHDDMARGPQFDIFAYCNLKTNKEKISFLLKYAGIAGWIDMPLMRNDVINNLGYFWFVLNETDLQWAVGVPRSNDLDQRKSKLPYIKEFAESIFKDQIVDIDIDVLLPIENKLTQIEKGNVLKGLIPQLIEQKLREMADAASVAKVVTIATSPAFIVQDRAIIYTKKLLEFMGA